MMKQVIKQIDAWKDADPQAATTSEEINKAIVRISDHAKQQFSDAFVDLYRISVPFVLLASFSTLLFRRKRQTEDHMSTE